MTTTPEAASSAVERAWRDLPVQLQAHPGIKALHRAALAAQPAPGAVLGLVANELERIAHEPPVNGNMLAQARLLLRVQQIRSGAA